MLQGKGPPVSSVNLKNEPIGAKFSGRGSMAIAGPVVSHCAELNDGAHAPRAHGRGPTLRWRLHGPRSLSG